MRYVCSILTFCGIVASIARIGAVAERNETCSAVDLYKEHFVRRQEFAVGRLLGAERQTYILDAKRGGHWKKGALVALLTFPNSGTTWVRSLYEMATKIASESVYVNLPCKRLHEQGTCASVQEGASRTGGRRGRGISDLRLRREEEPALVKTHHAITKNHRFDRVIRIIRNPIDNVVANFNYLSKNNWLEPLSKFRALKPSFNRFYRDQIRLYVRWHCRASREASRTPTLTVAYEDLVENPFDSMVKILTFLGWKVDTEMRDRLKDGIEKFPPRSRHVPRDVPMYLSYFNGSKFLVNRAIGILEEEVEAMEREEECLPLRQGIYKDEKRSSLVFFYSLFECPECNFSLQSHEPLVSEGTQVLERDPNTQDVFRAVWDFTCFQKHHKNPAGYEECARDFEALFL
eukprot:g2454.t1